MDFVDQAPSGKRFSWIIKRHLHEFVQQKISEWLRRDFEQRVIELVSRWLAQILRLRRIVKESVLEGFNDVSADHLGFFLARDHV